MRMFTRRQFLQTSVAGAGALAVHTVFLPEFAAAQARAAAPVRFGIIGVGMHGSGLLKKAIELPGAECVAACDVYDGRHTLAREIVRPDLPTTRRYQDLLENKQIDCIIAAVPDHWHKQIAIDTVRAGKDLYCEKPLTHSADEGPEIVAAARKANRIVQVGSQRTSSALFAKARELYQAGAIGEISLVEASWGRNDPTGAWQYPPPSDLSPANVDWETWLGPAPKRPFDPLLFARWRAFKDFGTGPAGDLMVHLISGIQFVLGLNQPPRRAMALGGNFRWKDGRDTPDVQPVLLEYGSLPVYGRVTLGTDTPEGTRFFGSRGILEITDSMVIHTPQPGIDLAPSYYSDGFPEQMRQQYIREWHAKNDPPPGKEPTYNVVRYQGTTYQDATPHLWNFFEAVRSRKPVVQDADFGHRAALACHMANASLYRREPVTFDTGSGKIKAA
jgi:predicted dehydrogenase